MQRETDHTLEYWVDSARSDRFKNSMNYFAGDGVSTEYDINFAGGYIKKEDVKVYQVNPQSGARFEVAIVAIVGQHVTVDRPTPVGRNLVIFRDTDKRFPLVDFADNSIINERNLDLNAKQSIFSVAEMLDRFDDSVQFAFEAAGAVEEARKARDEAIAAARASELSSLASQDAARRADASAIAAAESQRVASLSAVAAAASADTAVAAKNSATQSQTLAAASQVAAKVSEAAAEGYKNTALASSTSASASAVVAESAADRAEAAVLPAVDLIASMEVPFPDVWIPFSDDLSMLAGTNHAKMPCKFGDDTIWMPSNTWVSFERAGEATYTDKSGVLRVAKINEPRFEKEGLLIEGQSTNLLSNPSVPGEVQSSGVTDSFVNHGSNAKVYSQTTYWGAVSAVGVHTISVFVKPNDPSKAIRLNPYPDNAQLDFHCANRTVYSAGTSVISANGVVDDLGGGWYRISMQVTLGSTALVLHSYPNQTGNPCAYEGAQIEPLPFATSYIPTNGAAVTRAADRCWVQGEGNTSEGDSTVAVNAEVKGSGLRRLIMLRQGYQGLVCHPGLLRGSSSRAPDSLEPSVPDTGGAWSGLVTTVDKAGDNRKVSKDGVIYRAPAISPSTHSRPVTPITIGCGDYSPAGFNWEDPINGHIRNLRIWHSALTDAQIKGLK